MEVWVGGQRWGAKRGTVCAAALCTQRNTTLCGVCVWMCMYAGALSPPSSFWDEIMAGFHCRCSLPQPYSHLSRLSAQAACASVQEYQQAYRPHVYPRPHHAQGDMQLLHQSLTSIRSLSTQIAKWPAPPTPSPLHEAHRGLGLLTSREVAHKAKG